MEVEKNVVLVADHGRLSSAIKRALKGASALGLRFEQVAEPLTFNRDKCSVTLLFDHRTPPDEFGVVRRTRYQVKGFVGWISAGLGQRLDGSESGRYERSRENVYDPAGGYWSISAANDNLRNIVGLLRPGTVLEFRVRLDYATTALLASCGAHGDMLTLVTWSPASDRESEFVLDQEIGSPGYRFGRGQPSAMAAVRESV